MYRLMFPQVVITEVLNLTIQAPTRVTKTLGVMPNFSNMDLGYYNKYFCDRGLEF